MFVSLRNIDQYELKQYDLLRSLDLDLRSHIQIDTFEDIVTCRYALILPAIHLFETKTMMFILLFYKYRVSNKKSYSSFWLVFKNACANIIQTYHGHSLKDGKNHSHKREQLGRVTTSGMRLA